MAEKQKKDKMSEGMKAEINKQRKEQGKKSFGEYYEAPGGGTPAEGGGRGAMKKNFVVADSPEDPIAIEAKNKGQAVRYNQPRDEDGQFTYNSANGKGLSTKYSRGFTEPPFLDGVDLTFIKKGSVLKYETGEKDEEGNPVTRRIISSIDMTREELVNACKVYFKTEGGFLGVIGTAVTKKGASSKQEREAGLGKIGETDISAKSQSTQDEIEAASKNKDETALQKQGELSEINEIKSKIKMGLRAGVGARAGSNDENFDPEKNKISDREADAILNALTEDNDDPEFNITKEDLISMFEDGTLTREDFEEVLGMSLLDQEK